jgi:hypothetical protein
LRVVAHECIGCPVPVVVVVVVLRILLIITLGQKWRDRAVLGSLYHRIGILRITDIGWYIRLWVLCLIPIEEVGR